MREPGNFKIFTLKDFDRHVDADEDEDQNSFVGGSKSSGLLVKDDVDANISDVVNNIMKVARKQNKVVEKETDENVAIRNITFWKNGFTIDEIDPETEKIARHGDLLSYEDQKNKDVLNSIKEGVAPTKELNIKYGQAVKIRIKRFSHKEYKNDKSKTFPGTGVRLGSVIPEVRDADSSSKSMDCEKIRVDDHCKDNSETTRLKIRVFNNEYIIEKFNIFTTVGEILDFLSRKFENSHEEFKLYTAFSAGPLDKNKTLKELGLLNSNVIYK